MNWSAKLNNVCGASRSSLILAVVLTSVSGYATQVKIYSDKPISAQSGSVAMFRVAKGRSDSINKEFFGFTAYKSNHLIHFGNVAVSNGQLSNGATVTSAGGTSGSPATGTATVKMGIAALGKGGIGRFSWVCNMMSCSLKVEEYSSQQDGAMLGNAAAGTFAQATLTGGLGGTCGTFGTPSPMTLNTLASLTFPGNTSGCIRFYGASTDTKEVVQWVTTGSQYPVPSAIEKI